MTERTQTILTVAMAAYTSGWLMGLFVASAAQRCWRSPMQRPRGSYGTRRGGSLGAQPLILNEGRTIRGNGVGAPATPKPDIIPKPQPPGGRFIREDFLP